MIHDHDPIDVSSFGGLYGRDTWYDSVPKDHFIDSLNIITNGDEFKTRDGFSPSITLANLRQIAVYKREGEASRMLTLNSSGSLFDTTSSLVTPILTIVGMLGFSIETQYNRCFISPHNGVKGLSGEFVYIYSGSGVARKAAGLAPVGDFTVANGSAGNVDAGTHLVGCCYETDSGFVTPPGNIQVIVCDGTTNLSITNAPVGPAGTAKRRFLLSQSIQDYDGNTEGYEMFFVPDGEIINNVDTTITLNAFDEDLQITADYTFDQLEEIPAGVSLGKYDVRLVVCGPNDNSSVVWISNDTEPESFNAAAGFVVCDPFETEGVRNSIEYRGSLYLFKGNPGHTYQTTDNGYDPSTWDCPRVDSAIGADINCVSQFVDSKGANADFFLVADNAGLFVFNGSYQNDFPLSWKVKNWWERINKAYMNSVQLVLDPTTFRIYISVPLDTATSPSHILVADYSKGLDYENIRWNIWNSAEFAVQSITVDLSNTTKKNSLKVAGRAGNIYDQIPAQYNDNGTAIDNYFVSALVYDEPNWIHHYAAIGLKMAGSGVLALTGYTLDYPTTSQILTSLTLANNPNREYLIDVNITNEKACFKARLNSADKYFRCREYIFYAMPVWATRPG